MTKLLYHTSKFIDAFSNGFGRWLSWLTLIMAILMFVVVFFRYALNLGSIALQESVLYLHATIFMGASAYTLLHDGHVRVDVFYRRFSPKTKASIDLFGTLVFLLPVCIFISLISLGYINKAWAIKEASSEPGGLPGVFLLKSLIYLLSASLFLQGLSEALKNFLFLTGQSSAPIHTSETHYNG